MVWEHINPNFIKPRDVVQHFGLTKTNMMSRKKITYILIILSAILLIVNISNLNFKNLSENNYLGIVSNVLLILAMIFTARDINKDEKK